MNEYNEYKVTVINRKTASTPELDRAIYVGRPGPLGNPFSASEHGRLEAIALYKQWLQLQYLTGNKAVIDALIGLAKILYKDKEITLSCWCAPEPCHADIIGLAIRNMINRQLIDRD